MGAKNVNLIRFAEAGMQLSWLYAWTNLIVKATLHQAFPLIESVAVFGFTAFLSHMGAHRGWRNIHTIALYLLLISIAAVRMLYIFNWISLPLFSRTWAAELFRTPDHMQELLVLTLAFMGVVLFWRQGMAFARQSRSYYTVCDRFELGMAAFFCLFLINSIVIKLENSMAEILLVPFFIFSLFAIGLARSETGGTKNYLDGFKGVGVMISFIMVLILVGTGAVLFALPYLTQAAELGYGILKTTTQPISSLLAGFIRSILGGQRTSNRVSELTGMDSRPGIGEYQIQPGEDVFAWILLFIFSVMVLEVVVLGLWHLMKRPKTSGNHVHQGLGYLILRLFKQLQKILLFLWKKIQIIIVGYKTAADIYAALLGWGRSSGMPSLPNETPFEYGLRLEKKFSSVKKEIGSIIQVFNKEVYGENVTSAQQLAKILTAWRKLGTPLLWPSRIKSWMFRA